MRHGHNRAMILLQMALQPGDRLGVKVVGRLVHEQQVGLLEQHLAQGHTPPFAAGQRLRPSVSRRQTHGVDRDLQMAIEVVGVGRVDGVLDLAHRLHDGVDLIGGRLGHLVAEFLLPG